MESGGSNSRRDRHGGEISIPPQEDTSSLIDLAAAIPLENQDRTSAPFQNRTFSRGLHTSLPALRIRRIIQAFGISDLRITPERAHPGDIIYISFKATNSSHSTSIYTVSLKINGRIAAADVISLPPRSTLPLSFPVAVESPGYFRVEVNDQTSSYVVYGKEARRTARSQVAQEHEPAYGIERKRKTEEPGTVVKYSKTGRHTPANTGAIQSSIDNAGNVIEHGLDKIGDGLILPIVLIIKAVNRLRGM